LGKVTNNSTDSLFLAMLTRLLFRHSAITALLVGILALALKISIAFLPLPWMRPALGWSLAGNRWISGYTLYSEVYTTLDPLSVLFYGIFSSLVQNTLFHLIGSSIVILFIAFYYNHLLNKHKVYQKSNYFPAILILVFTSLYPDQILLSPSLLGVAFLLPAFNMIITHFRQEQKEEYFFRMGLLIGISALFFHGYWLMLLMMVLVTLLFTISSPRKIILMVLGAVFPVLLLAIYYFWINNLGNWYRCNISFWFNWPDNVLFTPLNLLKISIIPGILLIFSFFAVAGVRFIHFQFRVLQLHLTWLLFSVLIFILNIDFGIYNSIIFWIPFTYFVSHLFISIQNTFIRECLFVSSVAGILILFFFVLAKGDDSSKKIFVYTDPVANDKKILLLSDSLQYSIGNKICGPYVDWKKFNSDFKNLDDYANLSHIYGTINNEAPGLIIDGDAYLPKLMKRIPEIEQNYTSKNGIIYTKK
jgi:MFS family permease